MHAQLCSSAHVQPVTKLHAVPSMLTPCPRRDFSRSHSRVTSRCYPLRANNSSEDEDKDDLEYFRSCMEPMASNPGYTSDITSQSFPWGFLDQQDSAGPHPGSIANPSFGIDLLLLGPYNRVKQVFAILFGDRGKEGIYSLRRSSNGLDSLPQEIIITFESEEDARRYASLLEATMDRTPQVSLVPVDGLCHFCEEHGYQCRMQPAGALLIPPSFNVADTDWERSERLRNGHWSVMHTEPDLQPDSGAGRATMSRLSTLWGISDLDEVKARLEKLLPPGSTDDVSSDDVSWKYK